ncbi:GNAT family N-acetyltransferase [Paralimibaculum aggregatum]|uniref:GNAT family N-acetyltransferase n=1 Tax=Paralimibaculum aggregatum TaxID=3036245 RepID=A0ABQ6LQP9_9RHOB|nr:GNAT family N-acetyltransferase [Limibaculum sp. NKW23]GMG82990.1 GNAT family N-acetyltransferase [Limibaculum sp. NKW23]
MPVAPLLTTDRLVLRPHRVEDHGDVAALWGDPAVVRHITGRPATASEAWARLLRHAGHWALMGFGYWAVTGRETGTFLGEVGLAEYRRAVTPGFDGRPEAGWVMATAAQGRGLAREAVAAALAWADTALPAAETVCMIAPEHAASLRLARDLGYGSRIAGHLAGEPVAILRRPRGG